MITFDPETKTIHMSLVDLEHCGFHHGSFIEELFIAGLDVSQEEIIWPDMLFVDFRAGVITGEPNA